MRQKSTGSEQRQHIVLSPYAYNIICNDSLSFTGKANVSGFINKLIENSIVNYFEYLVDVEEERIKNELGKKKLSEEEKTIIHKIAVAHKDSIIHPKEKYKGGITKKIRLNEKAFKALYSEKWAGYKEENDITPGEYIKVIVEDYARRSLFQREAIFYKDLIDKIELYANLTSKDNRVLYFSLTSSKNCFFFKPYRISKEYEANYHYLIGLSKMEGTDEYLPVPVRLSRIRDLEVRNSAGSGRLTKAEKDEIEKMIEKRGVPYMRTGTNTYKVYITADGMNMYNGIYEQRPIYDKKEPNDDGSCIMTITATDMQITNYFFQFRGKAYIISPEETKNRLKEWYQDGLDAFEKGLAN